MISVSGFLRLTTVAAIAIGHPIAASALTALEISQIAIPTAAVFDSPLGSSSRAIIEPGKVDMLHLFANRNVLVSWQEDQPPPRPDTPGGSR